MSTLPDPGDGLDHSGHMASGTRTAVIGGTFVLLAAIVGAAATLWVGSRPEGGSASGSDRAAAPAGSSAAPSEESSTPNWSEERWRFRKISVAFTDGNRYEMDVPEGPEVTGESDFLYEGASRGLIFENGAHLIPGIDTQMQPEIQSCVDNAEADPLPVLKGAKQDSWWCVRTSEEAIIALKVVTENPMTIDIYDVPS